MATSGAKPTRLVDRIGDELVIGAGLTFAGANHSASASLNGDEPTRNGNDS